MQRSSIRPLTSRLFVCLDFPYPKAKLHFLIEADLWEDRDWLAKLIQVTATELPAPKPKKKKMPNTAFNVDSLQRGIGFANFIPPLQITPPASRLRSAR
jgi:hypothetical protein